MATLKRLSAWLVVCLLLAVPAHASIAPVAVADLGNNGGSGTLTTPYTVTTGDFIVAGLAGDTTTDNVTGVTYNGVAMIRADFNIGTGMNDRTNYQYFLAAPATGTHDFVVTVSSGYVLAVISEYSGMQAASQPDGTNALSHAQDVTGTIAVGTVNSWGVMTVTGFDNSSPNSPPTAGTGSTRRVFDGAFGAIALFDSNGDLMTGSQSMTAQYGSFNTVGAVMVTYKPATGGGGGTVCQSFGALGVGCR